MAINIIELTYDDIAELVALEKRCFTEPWSKAMFENELENSHAHWLLCKDEQKRILGYVGFWMILDEAHITNVAVDQEFRNHGLGKLLMKTAVMQAIMLNAIRMTLEVRPSNAVALKLYEELDFKLYGNRKGYYENGEDALIYWKQLEK